MNDLVTLPFELQIVIVSGYFGYKLYTTGRNVPPRTEDFLLQVLAFGLVARVSTAVLKALAIWITGPLNLPDAIDIVLIAVVTMTVALLIAGLWRTVGNKSFSRLMDRLNVYRDDHEHSTFASLIALDAVWNSIQLHLEDGRILESNFAALPEDVPGGPITVNDDGLAIYVTATYDKNLKRRDTDVTGANSDYVVTYVPRSIVRQMDIAWASKPTASVVSGR